MKPTSGICVDGSSRGNPGPAGYKAVDLATGKELFNVSIGDSTNNIAEFIGLVHAIDYAIKNGYTHVYSDSQTAIAWVRNKKSKSTLVSNVRTERSINLMNRAENHLSKLPGHFKLVHKWETGKWGENEADFGYK
jgi:ribonuclease HI